MWAFLGVVLIATALYLGMSNMSTSEVKALPWIFSYPYQWGGPNGVAVAILAVGSSLILLNLFVQVWNISRQPLLVPAEKLTSPEMREGGSSFIQLETSKFLQIMPVSTRYDGPVVAPELGMEAPIGEEAEAEMDHFFQAVV